MIRKLYYHLSDAILWWRYRRLFRRLFWHYTKRYDDSELAVFHATEAFVWLTGYEWTDCLKCLQPKRSRLSLPKAG